MRDADVLREALPGQWRVLATTFPMWLSGRRLQPVFTYALLPGPSLTLSDDVTYRTRSGATKTISGVDTFDAGTGAFTWRGRGLLGVLTSRWSVEHLSDDHELIVLTFARSPVTPAGMDVIGLGLGERPTARDNVPYDDALHWIG